MKRIFTIVFLVLFISCGTQAKLEKKLSTKEKGEALIDAVKSNSFEEVKRLVNLGYDIQYKNKDAYNLLNIAAKYASLEINEYLIKQGVDLNNKDYISWTPLNEACRYNREKLVKLYIDSGVNLNSLESDPIDCTLTGAHEGYLEIIALLVDYGYDLNISLRDNLNTAIAYDMVDALKLMVEKGASLKRHYSDNTWNYLHWAAHYQAPACSEYLMQFDFLNVKTDKDYIDESVFFGNEKRTILFPSGIFAVDIARMSGNMETYKILKDKQN